MKKGKNYRNRYVPRLTIGYNENGKTIYKYLKPCRTKADAQRVLDNYNVNPYDIDGSRLTFAEIYDIIIDNVLKGKSESAERGYKSAFRNCKDLHNKRICDIRKTHLQAVIDNCKARSGSSLNNIIKLYHAIFNYAMENDYIQKDYSRFVKISEVKATKEKTIFTDEEIKKMWDNIDNDFNKITLILLYTGLRVNELLDLSIDGVHIEDNYLQGGKKTRAGKNRIVPIHHKIKPLIEYFYGPENEILISSVTDERLNNYLKAEFKERTAHTTRHTFTSLLQKYGAAKVYIDKIIGHSSGNLTDDLYTHADLEKLIETIELIP